MKSKIPEELIPMGYVRGVFGVRGWLKLHVDTEYSDSMFDYANWYLGKNEQWQHFRFEEGKLHASTVLAKLAGIDDRDQALALRGMTLAVSRADLPKPEEDEFYWHDLVGLQVENQQHIVLGRVLRLLDTGAHDVLVVRTEEGHERLIPFVAQHVLQVDLAAGLIHVDWHPDD